MNLRRCSPLRVKRQIEIRELRVLRLELEATARDVVAELDIAAMTPPQRRLHVILNKIDAVIKGHRT